MARVRSRVWLDGGDSLNRGLVGYWPLSDGGGLVANDIGPARYNGALVNIVQGATSGWQGTQLGTALRFDGSNDYVTMPQHRFPSGNSVYSASAWVFCPNPYRPQKFLVWGKPGSVRQAVMIGLASSGQFVVDHWGDDWTSPIYLTPSVWTHVGVVYNGSGDSLYVNGVLVASDTVASALNIDTSTKPAELGRLDTVGEYYGGFLSNVRVYRRMLLPSEIARLARDPWAGTWDRGDRLRRMVAASGGTDDLTADDLTTGAPVLGAPALGQAHALTATGLAAGAPTLGTPAIGQAHALAAAGITAGAPTLGAPALGQGHALAADGLAAGAPVLGSPAVGQVHALAAPPLASGAPVLGAPTLAQVHALVAGGITTGAPVLGSPALDAPTSVAPAERTIAWAYQSRTAAWREESRVVSWPFRSRTVTWRQ
jgi:hypothetical protein